MQRLLLFDNFKQRFICSLSCQAAATKPVGQRQFGNATYTVVTILHIACFWFPGWFCTSLHLSLVMQAVIVPVLSYECILSKMTALQK